MAAWGLYNRNTGHCATKDTNTWEDEATRKDTRDTTLLEPGEFLQICLLIAAVGEKEVQRRARKEVPHPVHQDHLRIFFMA